MRYIRLKYTFGNIKLNNNAVSNSFLGFLDIDSSSIPMIYPLSSIIIIGSHFSSLSIDTFIWFLLASSALLITSLKISNGFAILDAISLNTEQSFTSEVYYMNRRSLIAKKIKNTKNK